VLLLATLHLLPSLARLLHNALLATEPTTCSLIITVSDIDLHRQRIFMSAECTDANMMANIRIRLRSRILIFAIIFGVLAPVVVFIFVSVSVNRATQKVVNEF